MAEGLPVSRVVDVDVNFAPVAAPAAAFDTLLIMGDSTVLSPAKVFVPMKPWKKWHWIFK